MENYKWIETPDGKGFLLLDIKKNKLVDNSYIHKDTGTLPRVLPFMPVWPEFPGYPIGPLNPLNPYEPTCYPLNMFTEYINLLGK